MFINVGKVCLTLKRRGLAVTLKGKPTPAPETTVKIEANVQPAGYEDLRMFSESDQTREGLKVYSPCEIRQRKEGLWEADRFQWEGDWYTVVRVTHYSMGVKNHWKAIAVRDHLGAKT